MKNNKPCCRSAAQWLDNTIWIGPRDLHCPKVQVGENWFSEAAWGSWYTAKNVSCRKGSSAPRPVAQSDLPSRYCDPADLASSILAASTPRGLGCCWIQRQKHCSAFMFYFKAPEMWPIPQLFRLVLFYHEADDMQYLRVFKGSKAAEIVFGGLRQ